MNRNELDPRLKDLVYPTYGDTHLDQWEALSYISNESFKRIGELARKYNTSPYSLYLDVIRGIRIEEFLK